MRILSGRSLATRLVAAAAAWCLLALILAGVGLSQLYRQSVLRGLDSDLQVVLRALAATVTPAGDGVALSQAPNDPRFAQTFSGRYWQVALLTEDGGVDPEPQLRSASLWDEELPLTEPVIARLADNPGATIFLDAQGPNEQLMRIAAQRVRLEAVDRPIALMAAADVRPALADAQRFTTTLFVALAVLGAGLLAAVFLQVRIALAPLNRVRADIAEVRRGRRAKLDGAYPDEIAPLTTELNALLDHNRDVVERARTHVGNLAHALKTPISVLLNEARGTDGPLAELVTRQTEGMARNVEHYLQRAQAAARAEALGARTPVKPVLEDIARTLLRLYGARKDMDVTVEAERDAVFRGERQDLEEMAGNLMDNACKYGGGVVRVRLDVPARAGEAFKIAVEDDGPGLSAEQREVALQRGVRLDEKETGAGLGLSIIADLSRAYGGRLALDGSELGGLRATLTLPSAE